MMRDPRTSGRAGLAAVAAICVLGALARPAHADRAEQLFRTGKKLLADKRYPEACAALEESDRLDPRIGTKLNVAKCYEEWGKLATAWRWYTDAEQVAEAAKDDRAPKIHALLEELDDSIPRLIIKAAPGADTRGVSILLDGLEVDVKTLGSERRVDPGTHKIVYIVDGRTLDRTVPVERSGSSEITLDLPARPARGGAPRTAGDDRVRTRQLIGLGVAGAGGLAMSIAGIVTLRAHDDYDHALSRHCRGATDMCDALGLAATRSARHRANIATGFTIAGAAAVAGGLVLYVLAPRAAARAEEHALYLAPLVGDRGSGIVLGGDL